MKRFISLSGLLIMLACAPKNFLTEKQITWQTATQQSSQKTSWEIDWEKAVSLGRMEIFQNVYQPR